MLLTKLRAKSARLNSGLSTITNSAVIAFFFIILFNLFTDSQVLAEEIALGGCSFSELKPGYLVPSTGNLPTSLVSDSSAGGVPSQINITCNQSANLLVSPPNQVSGPQFNPTSAVARVETLTGSATNSANASSLPLNIGTIPLIINISVDKGSPLTPGNYTYAVTLTIVP